MNVRFPLCAAAPIGSAERSLWAVHVDVAASFGSPLAALPQGGSEAYLSKAS